MLASFNRVKELTEGAADTTTPVVTALRALPELRVSDDGLRVCRRARLPTKDDSEARTVYVERLPAGATIEAVKALLGGCGAIAFVSLPRQQARRTTAFVEFTTAEAAEVAVQRHHAGADGADSADAAAAPCVMSKAAWGRMRASTSGSSRRASPRPRRSRRRRRRLTRSRRTRRRRRARSALRVAVKLSGIPRGGKIKPLRRRLGEIFGEVAPVEYVDYGVSNSGDPTVGYVRMKTAIGAAEAVRILAGRGVTLEGAAVAIELLTGATLRSYLQRIGEIKAKTAGRAARSAKVVGPQVRQGGRRRRRRAGGGGGRAWRRGRGRGRGRDGWQAAAREEGGRRRRLRSAREQRWRRGHRRDSLSVVCSGDDPVEINVDQCMNGLRPTTKSRPPSSRGPQRQARLRGRVASTRRGASRRAQPVHVRTGVCPAHGRQRRANEQSPQKTSPHARQWWRRRRTVKPSSHCTHALLSSSATQRGAGWCVGELAAAADAATAAAVQDPRRAQLLLDLGAHLLAPRRAHGRRRVVAAQRAALERRKPNPTPSFESFAIRGAAGAGSSSGEAEARRRRRAERVAGVARAVGARGEEQLVPNAQQRRERDAADKRRAEPRVRHDLRDVGDFGDVDRRGHRQPLRRERRHLAGEPLQSRKRRAVEVGRVEDAERRAEGPERALLGERRGRPLDCSITASSTAAKKLRPCV